MCRCVGGAQISSGGPRQFINSKCTDAQAGRQFSCGNWRQIVINKINEGDYEGEYGTDCNTFKTDRYNVYFNVDRTAAV